MLKAASPGLENLSFMVGEVCSEATKTKAPISKELPCWLFVERTPPSKLPLPRERTWPVYHGRSGIQGDWESKELGSSSGLATHRLGTISQATELLWALDSYLLNKSDYAAGLQVVLRRKRACMEPRWPLGDLKGLGRCTVTSYAYYKIKNQIWFACR